MTRAKLRTIKLATLRVRPSEEAERKMCLLGESGYSWKYICATVFNKKRGAVTDRDLRALGRVFKANKIRVTDYRNGENEVGQVLARRIMKRRVAAAAAKLKVAE